MDVKNEEPSSSPMPSELESEQNLSSVMLRLACAMEEQNRALWELVHQTAALIGTLVEGSIEDDEDDGEKRYLDGSRIS